MGGDGSSPPGELVGSEDCLFLNVYAPVFAPAEVPSGAERLPVLFWIHGGGNTIGTARFYDGGRLAATQQVVVVTLNYRLGAFGWFRHPALAAGGEADERSGNFGTLDLIHALGWVRDNIAAFGGDPGNVTIFGESAGGTNVLSLLVSPATGGLFHRAIVQSGSARSVTPATAENYADDAEPGDARSSREIVLELLQAEGAAQDRESARARAEALEPTQLASWLRSKSVAEILAAYRDPGLGMYDLPKVIRDGAVLPSRPIHARLAEPGGAQPVPVVLGTNRDEVKLFYYVDPTRVRQWFGLFPQVLDADRYALDAYYENRLWKATGADEIARSLSAAGRADVFVYRFDWDEEPGILWIDLGQLLGAAHGFEIPFVFGHWDLGSRGRFLFTDENESGREALSAAMRSYWTQFAAVGRPGRGRAGELPPWRPWESDPERPKLLVLDTPSDGGPRMSSESVTVAGILDEIDEDPRLADPSRRCEILAFVVRRVPTYGAGEYAAAGCDAVSLLAKTNP